MKRSEFEQILIYTDILESILEQSFRDGQDSKTLRYYSHMTPEAYAKDKIAFIRKDIAGGFITRYEDLRDEHKNPPKQPTAESLEADGFGVATTKEK